MNLRSPYILFVFWLINFLNAGGEEILMNVSETSLENNPSTTPTSTTTTTTITPSQEAEENEQPLLVNRPFYQPADLLDPIEVHAHLSASIALIHQSTVKELLNLDYLEHYLIPALGLNDEYLNEFPIFLLPFTGKGIRAWQYPNQLSKYLIFLATQLNPTVSCSPIIDSKPFKRYLEIGVRFGGTFLLIHEYLKALGKPLEYSVAVDIVQTNHMTEYIQSLTTTYSEYYLHHFPNLTSPEIRFKLGEEGLFDVCFIDGDHSFEGVQTDFLRVKNHCRYIVFHDVVNDKAVGSRDFWNLIKVSHSDRYLYEIADQYPEVIEANHGMHYLGFGILHNLH